MNIINNFNDRNAISIDVLRYSLCARVRLPGVGFLGVVSPECNIRVVCLYLVRSPIRWQYSVATVGSSFR